MVDYLIVSGSDAIIIWWVYGRSSYFLALFLVCVGNTVLGSQYLLMGSPGYLHPSCTFRRLLLCSFVQVNFYVYFITLLGNNTRPFSSSSFALDTRACSFYKLNPFNPYLLEFLYSIIIPLYIPGNWHPSS